MDFLITGLPRSRTAWLANLMTYGGVYCHHDASMTCRLLSDLIMITDMSEYTRVGNSDSGALIILGDIVAVRPDVRIVLIKRDVEDSMNACKRALGSVPDDFVRYGSEMMHKAEHDYNALCVDFESLDKTDVCETIWRYCVPGLPFDRKRCAMLNKMNVQVELKKYTHGISPRNIASEAFAEIRG